MISDTHCNINPHRPLTLHEKEEQRLWHGGDYYNLPEHTGRGTKHESLEWLEQNNARHFERGLSKVSQVTGEKGELPYHPQGNTNVKINTPAFHAQ